MEPDASYKNVHEIVFDASSENVHKVMSEYITNKYNQMKT